MGLNKVDDYFRKDTELQNYTETGVKRIINSLLSDPVWPIQKDTHVCINHWSVNFEPLLAKKWTFYLVKNGLFANEINL